MTNITRTSLPFPTDDIELTDLIIAAIRYASAQLDRELNHISDSNLDSSISYADAISSLTNLLYDDAFAESFESLIASPDYADLDHALYFLLFDDAFPLTPYFDAH